MCLLVYEREHERISKVQEEKKQQNEMKRLKDDEQKKKSKKGGKNDTKEASRKKDGKQVCLCITIYAQNYTNTESSIHWSWNPFVSFRLQSTDAVNGQRMFSFNNSKESLVDAREQCHVNGGAGNFKVIVH